MFVLFCLYVWQFVLICSLRFIWLYYCALFKYFDEHWNVFVFKSLYNSYLLVLTCTIVHFLNTLMSIGMYLFCIHLICFLLPSTTLTYLFEPLLYLSHLCTLFLTFSWLFLYYCIILHTSIYSCILFDVFTYFCILLRTIAYMCVLINIVAYC